MRIRTYLAALIYLPVNAVLFGAGAIAVLTIDYLDERATVMMPLVIALSLLLAAPLSWMIAPRMRLRHWRRREQTG